MSYLILESGNIYPGKNFGSTLNKIGEVVFNTGITGYQEIMTDPSYYGQIIAFSYPHVGNVGICNADLESGKSFAEAIITRELPTEPSNWRSEDSLCKFLEKNNIAGLAEVDTRTLIKEIRNNGTCIGMIVNDSIAPNAAFKHVLEYKRSKVSPTSCSKNIADLNSLSTKNHFTVGLLDLGCKKSIVQSLHKHACNVVPINISDKLPQISALIISNGPGDPRDYMSEALFIQNLILKNNIPLLGICLGHQLLGLACGCTITKLRFGHHGINHSVKNLFTGRCFITSQNHNFVIDKSTFPKELVITHISLLDHSIQGFEHRRKLIVGFQGHPEGGPGPIDIQEDIMKSFILKAKLLTTTSV